MRAPEPEVEEKDTEEEAAEELEKTQIVTPDQDLSSFRVPKNELEQNLCKGLLNSRGTKLDIKINHLPMCANVDTCSFAILKGSSLFSDFSITVENNLILREDSI